MQIPLSDADVGARLDKLIVQKVPGLGRAAAKRLFAEGRVRVLYGEGKGRKASKGDVARKGDVLELTLDGPLSVEGGGGAVPDPDAPLAVVLETETVIVLDKPAGQPTAPLSPAERGTLANALIARYPDLAGVGFSPREPGLCHRLDTGTSGLVLAARTQDAFTALRAAIAEGRLDKRYQLLCASDDLPDAGTIEIPLAPHPKDQRRVYPCIHPRDVARYSPRPASTSYRVLERKGLYALVEARATKASRHQIRAHFAAIGHPLAGDVLYGGEAVLASSDPASHPRHALHASAITYGGCAKVPAFAAVSPLPADMAALFGG